MKICVKRLTVISLIIVIIFSPLTELFDEVLSKVSDYKQPTNESGQLTQGIYALKPDLWKSEFQPLHVMLRGSYKRGYQLAMDKYKGWYQSQNKTKVG